MFGHKAADCLEKKANDQKQARSANSTKTPKKLKGNCYYCSRKRYKQEECFKKKRDSEAENLITEPRKTMDVMLCGFCEDQDIFEVDSMYELVNSLKENFKIWIYHIATFQK